jgi:hypothetical protein
MLRLFGFRSPISISILASSLSFICGASPAWSASQTQDPLQASKQESAKGHYDRAYEILFQASQQNPAQSFPYRVELWRAWIELQHHTLLASENSSRDSLNFEKESNELLNPLLGDPHVSGQAKAQALRDRAALWKRPFANSRQELLDLEKALSYAPRDVSLLRELVRKEKASSHLAEAGVDAAQLSRLEPNNIKLRRQALELLLDQRNFNLVRDLALEGTKLKSQEPYFHAALGRALFEAGQTRAATGEMEKAWALDPKLELTRKLRAQILAEQAEQELEHGQEALALAHFDEGYRLNPSNVDLRKAIAQRIYAHWKLRGFPKNDASRQDYKALVEMLKKLPNTLDADKTSLLVLLRASLLSSDSKSAHKACDALRKDYPDSFDREPDVKAQCRPL